MKGESLDTCLHAFLFLDLHSINCCSSGTAGAGSLILEFATLGRLTGDERFEKAAYKAFFAIWNRKSDIGLVGNTINAWTGVGFVTFLHMNLVSKFIIGLDFTRNHRYRSRNRFVL